VVGVGNLIDPIWWGDPIRFLFTDPFPYHRLFLGGSRVPRDAIYDDIPISLFVGWKLTPRAERPFQSSSSVSQKSSILERAAFTRAFPSFLPLSPSGLPSWLVMKGFPKTSCLSVLAELVSSDLRRPNLTLIQEWRMLFHKEVGGLLSLVATNIQLMSWVVGPIP